MGEGGSLGAGRMRTALGLIELLFSSILSRKIFRERLSKLEIAGMGLLTLGLVIVTIAR